MNSNVYEMRGIPTEDPRLAELWDLGCEGMWEAERDGETVLLAFFPAPIELAIPGEWTMVEQRDWVGEYQQTLKPFTVGPLIIAPTHATVRVEAFQRVLWIDPGMAFGSGHHETTSMAIGALTRADLRGKTVLDVGSGSGILALAAELLGAAAAYGIDTDPGTVPVAQQNAAANGLRAKFAVGTTETVPLQTRYDVLVANLYAELHVELFADYAALLPAAGRLILTGILAAKAGLVRHAVPAEFELAHTETAGEWVLFELEKR